MFKLTYCKFIDVKQMYAVLFKKEERDIAMESLVPQSKKDIDSEQAEDDEYYEDGAIKYYSGKNLLDYSTISPNKTL